MVIVRSFCCSRARQAVDGAFQVDAFGRGRCTRRGKFSGPTPLEPSLYVKRNTAHTKAPRLSSPRSQGLNARDRLKVCFPPKRPQFGGEAGAIGGSGAVAARDVRLQQITSSSPPLFSFAHCPDFKSRGQHRTPDPRNINNGPSHPNADVRSESLSTEMGFPRDVHFKSGQSS